MILALFSSFKNSKEKYLVGVEKDKKNWLNFCAKYRIPLVCLCENDVTPNNFKNIWQRYCIYTNIVYISGHGLLNDNENIIHTTDHTTEISELDIINLLTNTCPSILKNILIFIVDTCHSGSFLDLPYAYENKCYKKTYKQTAITNDILIIVLSACSDYQKTDDTFMGGQFTQEVVKQLDKCDNLFQLIESVNKNVKQMNVTTNKNNLKLENISIIFTQS